MRKTWMAMVGVSGAIVIASCGERPTEEPISFVNDVRPILEGRCLACHHTGALMGRFNLESKELAFSDDDGRVFIAPGDPEGSKVYIALTLPRDNEGAMPPEGHRVPGREMDIIRRWIAEGAEWPDGEDGLLVRTVPE